MKWILGLVALMTLAFPVCAQRDNAIVNVTVIGNKNLRMSVDNRDLTLTNSTATGNTTTGTIDRLAMGQHTVVISRMDVNTNRQSTVNSVFFLRQGYDMDITVNGNGSIELIESRRGGVYNDDPPMGSTAFSNLLRSVRAQRSTNQKVAVISTAFNNSSTYFSVSQVDQLIRLVDQEPAKLQLAKQSYSHLTDPDNFNQLYYLFSNDNSRTELYDYVYNYNPDNAGNNNGNYAMSDNDFNTLYQTIRQQWPPATQVNSIADAFNSTTNYFNTAQVIKMIQLVNSEANRLRLAKLSYRSVTDRNNFNQVFSLLGSQSSRDELTAFVNNYDTNGGGGIGNTNGAMSEYDFLQLYNNIKSEWPASAQLNMALSAVNDRYNKFTSAQVVRLMQLFSNDDDKLQLAKASYRVIVDRNNINQLYDALRYQNSKDDLRRYITNYREDNNNNNTRTPMSDGNFASLKSSVQQKFFPGEKYSTLLDIFNNTSYYFTSNQAKQLIELVSLESNRLGLAKLSYRTITDRGNFRMVSDLLASQNSRNDLDDYVKNYKD